MLQKKKKNENFSVRIKNEYKIHKKINNIVFYKILI
jgi:hypothetical protein